MTTPIDRVRAVALALPEVEETGPARFAVADTVFAEVAGDTLRLTGGGGREEIDLAGDPDWAAVEDRVARSWELAAPRGLLEAGGR